MIQNAIAIGSGGGSVEVITPTATALSNSNKTITLSGITSKPFGALAQYSTLTNVAIIYDANDNELVNFITKGTSIYTVSSFTYNQSTSKLVIKSIGTDFQNISKSNLKVLIGVSA